MSLTELQAWIAEDWKKNSVEQPSLELQLLYAIEEFGEIAEAIRKSKGAKERVNKDMDLGSEIADLLVAILTIANHFDVDTEREIRAFQTRIEQRHKDGF